MLICTVDYNLQTTAYICGAGVGFLCDFYAINTGKSRDKSFRRRAYNVCAAV
nr:MAG TPA: hypothetical protein [Caudoviricetes sp.]